MTDVRHLSVLSHHLDDTTDRFMLLTLAAVAEALESNGSTLDDEIERLELKAIPAWADHLEWRMQRREGCQGRYRNGNKCRAVRHPFCTAHSHRTAGGGPVAAT